MGRMLDPKKIKSAQRALEVLEYFNAERGEATVMDIARAMGYPQSSTSELLSCLVVLGYLHRDRYARTYRPSARVALLGAWVQPRLFRDGSLLPMMDDLADQTGLTIALATKIDLQIQFIHEVQGRESPRHRSFDHKNTLLLHSASGKTLLSQLDQSLVRQIVHRLNADSEPEMRVSFDTLSAELDDIRTKGYALGQDGEGGAMIAVLLPQSDGHELLSLGIWGPDGALAADTDRYVNMVRSAISRHLGLAAATPSNDYGHNIERRQAV